MIRLAFRAGKPIFALLPVTLTLAVCPPATAVEYHLYPGGSIGGILPLLAPGDTLIVHAGTYARVWMEGVHGATDAWITIKGADGEPKPVVTYSQKNLNVWDIYDCSYVKIQGFRILGGSDGINLKPPLLHDIVLEDLYIDPGDTGINLAGIVEVYNLTIRDVEIANTGGTGEGMYLGKHDGYTQPQLHDSLIERCYIHHLGGSQGDGIELKHGCYNVTIQDCVIIAQNGYPAITSWGTYKDDPAFNNRVRRNLIIGSTDAGIHVTGEIDIENNVVVNSISRGIHCRGRDVDGRMQYTRIVNNTIYKAGSYAVHLLDWDQGPGLVLANNAIYQDTASGQAVNAVDGLSGATVANNICYGYNNVSSPGLIAGDPPDEVFIRPTSVPGLMDFYPKSGSMLIGAGDGILASAEAFDGFARPVPGPVEVGAYEVYSDANPGWALDLDFKQIGAQLPGDTDFNGTVDVFDAITIVNAFGTSRVDPAWVTEADVNSDDAVDVFDVITVVNNFGTDG